MRKCEVTKTVAERTRAGLRTSARVAVVNFQQPLGPPMPGVEVDKHSRALVGRHREQSLVQAEGAAERLAHRWLQLPANVSALQPLRKCGWAWGAHGSAWKYCPPGKTPVGPMPSDAPHG